MSGFKSLYWEITLVISRTVRSLYLYCWATSRGDKINIFTYFFKIFCLPSCYSKFSPIQTESDHLYWLIAFISLQNISQTKNIYDLITRIMTKKIQLIIKVNLFDRYFALSVELMLTGLYFTDRPRLWKLFFNYYYQKYYFHSSTNEVQAYCSSNRGITDSYYWAKFNILRIFTQTTRAG